MLWVAAGAIAVAPLLTAYPEDLLSWSNPWLQIVLVISAFAVASAVAATVARAPLFAASVIAAIAIAVSIYAVVDAEWWFGNSTHCGPAPIEVVHAAVLREASQPLAVALIAGAVIAGLKLVQRFRALPAG